MKKGIIGAGGFGREVFWSLSPIERNNTVFFVNDEYWDNSNPNILPLSLFETDKYDVPITEENRLLLFISSLSDIDIESISIYGFCDDIGASEYNLKLSQDRANAIKAIFANNEISESLISNVDGKGEILLKIVDEKDVLKIRGLNRKVEIIINPKPPKTIEEKQMEAAVIKKDVPEQIKGDLKIGDKIVFENILFKTNFLSACLRQPV